MNNMIRIGLVPSDGWDVLRAPLFFRETNCTFAYYDESYKRIYA